MKNITLTAAVNEAVSKKIKSLENQVKRQQSKINRQEEKINALKRGASFSKEKRASLLAAVEDLLNELQCQEWVEIDRYYDNF